MRKTIFIFALLFIVIAATAEMLSPLGIAGRTGSPGETTCDTATCHNSYALNTGGGSVSITCSNMPGWQYVPGVTYHITVKVSKTAVPLFGFAMEALTISDNRSAGTMVVTYTTQTHALSAIVGGFPRISMTHVTNAGLTTGAHSFNFDWTAPATDVGSIMFYGAGNAANNNVMATGDYIYTATQLLTSPISSQVNEIVVQNTFEVYPNPISSECNISLPQDFSDADCTIQLFDARGNLVQRAENITAVANEILHFSINSNISNSVYFLRVIANGKTLSKKVMVDRE